MALLVFSDSNTFDILSLAEMTLLLRVWINLAAIDGKVAINDDRET